MAGGKFTKETAAEAGRKGKRGKNKINPNLKDYIQNEGSDKLLQEMQKLKGSYYVDAWIKIAPYLYPKLSAVTLEGDTSVQFNVKVPGSE